MPASKMHADEIDIDDDTARRLVDTQLPQWSNRTIERVDSDGTENAIFRLGNDLALRLPRHPRATKVLDKEFEWLPRLAPLLPQPITAPVARGNPDERFPFPWLVVSWVEGERATPERIGDPHRLAIDLAAFIAALQGVDTVGVPEPNRENYGRGGPLAPRDPRVRQCIAALGDTIATEAVTAAWELDLAAPRWSDEPRWIHGDLSPGNVLVRDGRLSGVIDFGGLGAGDPGCELAVAWMLFGREARASFRDALDVDEATWARGRAWALSIALFYIPYYADSNPEGCERARHVIDEVLDDHARGG